MGAEIMSRKPAKPGGARVIVCGTRTFWDSHLAYTTLDRMLRKLKNPEIIAGSPDGADALGDMWAQKKGYPVKRIHADWETHGKRAGPIRNTLMAEYAAGGRPGACIAFWDGVSSGTADMIAKARKAGLKVRVVEYKKRSLLT